MVKRAKRVPEKDEFGQQRSHKASEIAYDLCKTIAQSCLLINGGAATAVLALLSKDKVDQVLLKWVPWSLVGYATGVAFSTVMLFCVMMMADHWNYFWYFNSSANEKEYGAESETTANRWHYAVYAAFLVAIILFVLSSALVAYAMTHVVPIVDQMAG
jgi:hypothetical protein